jgi:hypothetical protein
MEAGWGGQSCLGRRWSGTRVAIIAAAQPCGRGLSAGHSRKRWLRVRRVRPATTVASLAGSDGCHLDEREAAPRNLVHRIHGARTTSEKTRNIMSLSTGDRSEITGSPTSSSVSFAARRSFTSPRSGSRVWCARCIRFWLAVVQPAYPLERARLVGLRDLSVSARSFFVRVLG